MPILRACAAGGRGLVSRAMASLRALLIAHAPLLFLDASSSRVQVGLIEEDGRMRWHAAEAEAGTAVFAGVAALGVDPTQVGAWVFCEGPGSILGIRTVAMAIRTWQTLAPDVRCVSYQSLELMAHALADPAATVIADARRETWHAMQLGQPMRRVPTAELPREGLVLPEGFRTWSKLPADMPVRREPYDLTTILPRAANACIFHATEAPDAFLHEEPSYVTWTPQIHRAPV